MAELQATGEKLLINHSCYESFYSKAFLDNASNVTVSKRQEHMKSCLWGIIKKRECTWKTK
jgi:hypothetical protein